jgi:hypothetical protein
VITSEQETKQYPDGTVAVDGLNLNVPNGISPDVPVRGFVFDVLTGRLSEVFPDPETVTGQ